MINSSEPGLLYILLGLSLCMLLITSITLGVLWLVHRDMDKQQMVGFPVAGWCETCMKYAYDLAAHLETVHPEKHDEGSAKAAVILIGLTAVLVAWGCVLYATGSVGWAQMLWVMASGTAGGGIMALSNR